MSGDLWKSIGTDDYEDVRLAVVMNGGVSLAVWIGGVALEINHLTSPDPSPAYRDLLSLLRSTARVDVISGTSAGGINGGFLALATAYGSDLSSLGNLWADAGGLQSLLRSPLEKQPKSLMKGNSYFLPELLAAYEQIVPPGSNRPVRSEADAPIHLTITTSVLDGRLRKVQDDFGQGIEEIDHRGRFVFTRGNRESFGPDDFQDGVTKRLALASRCTASFPGAFEPGFVPMGPNAGDELHPDMRRVANLDASGFVVDGGVLLNQPIAPALEAIYRQSAERGVRRLMAFVNPDPGRPKLKPHRDISQMPDLNEVLFASLLGMPQVQTITGNLVEMMEQNRQARDERELRPDLFNFLSPHLIELREQLFASYNRIRNRKAAVHIAGLLSQSEHPESVTPWSVDEIVAAFEAERDPGALPWIPEKPAWPEDARWDWGIAPLERINAFALDLMRISLMVTPYDRTELRAQFRSWRKRLHGCRVRLDGIRNADTGYWKTRALLPAPSSNDLISRRDQLVQWVNRVAANWPPAGDPGFTLDDLRSTVLDVTRILSESVTAMNLAAGLGFSSPLPEVKAAAKSLSGTLRGLTNPKQKAVPHSVEAPGAAVGEASAEEAALRLNELMARTILVNLLAFEVVHTAITGVNPKVKQEISLVQISGNTPNGFHGPTEAKKKLTGVQLNHFGAFYKRSWRVNDWIWGRLDGATRLVECLLGPSRLKALRLDPTDAIDLVEAVAGVRNDPDIARAPSPVSEYLARSFERDRAAIVDELSFLADENAPVPKKLPITAGAIARRQHLAIFKEELGRLADAVLQDADAGGKRRPSAVAFARRYDRDKGGLRDEDYFELFRDADIGREVIGEEVGTDLFAATTSKAAAVATSALDVSGLGPARTIVRSLRGVVLTVYALIAGVALRGRFGHWAVNATLATGGALMAIAILVPENQAGEGAPGLVKLLAATILVAGVAVAALRGKMGLFAAVLGLAAMGLLVILFASDVWKTLSNLAGTIAVTLGLVLAFVVLGSLPEWRWPKKRG